MTHTEDMMPDKLHFGTRLRNARETKHLSLEDIGSQLRLNPDIIQLIESGNYHKGPPAIFMRGYLRSYAKLMDFAESDILTALTDTGLTIHPDAPLVPNLKNTPADPSPTLSKRHWISTGILLTLAFLVFVWWNAYPVTLVRGLFAANRPLLVQSSEQAVEKSRADGASRPETAIADVPEAPLILPNNFSMLPDMTDTSGELGNIDPT